MEFTLRYVVDYKKRRSTWDILFTRIIEEFEKSEGRVEIASTSTEINITETPSMRVQLTSSTKDNRKGEVK
jgi:hypothetical protein